MKRLCSQCPGQQLPNQPCCPTGCDALLQRQLSLCLEFVNDLVSFIPGIELLISGVVMDHGVTSWPPREEQFGQVFFVNSA